MEQNNKDERTTTANSKFAIGEVSCSSDPFVAAGSFMLSINFCAKNPPHRQAAKR
jgi:hypothetical protein